MGGFHCDKMVAELTAAGLPIDDATARSMNTPRPLFLASSICLLLFKNDPSANVETLCDRFEVLIKLAEIRDGKYDEASRAFRL